MDILRCRKIEGQINAMVFYNGVKVTSEYGFPSVKV